MGTSVQQLWFTAPFAVELRSTEIREPAPGQLLVRTLCSAISAGTEMLVYRGQLPQDMALDASLDSLQDAVSYPLQYGYACVGEVIACGSDVDSSWSGRRVFSFQPHVSHFTAVPHQLMPVPDDVDTESAVFLANMETAVSLAHDGAPLLGEQVVVVGQGVVGLLLTGILAALPLAALYTLDTYSLRRDLSRTLGATDSFAPRRDVEQQLSVKQQLSQGQRTAGADLIYEVSGAPEALNLAISLSGFDSRIVVGSWYGSKSAMVDLGGDAHRNRLKISTSQVSTLGSALTGRWDKMRRFATAWDMIRLIQPGRLITHKKPLSEASDLYALLHNNADDVLQAVFVYE